MIVQLKNLIKKFLLSQEIFLNRTTDRNKILNYFELVKPIKTNHELIRIGSESDGGYLIPNDLSGIDTCFSPGVSENSDFENDLTKRGIKCFLADFSVNSPPIENPLFDFEKKFLGSFNNDTFMTLDNWISSKAPDKNDLILQMDIEWAEYAVIFDTSIDTFNKFRILVIEFHGLDNLLNNMGFELINLAFSKLLKNFEVVHIHPNNCCKPMKSKDIIIPPVMEFTFLRKDRVRHKSRNTSLPHLLDRKNVSNKPDFSLPSCWY